jgi:hypothetical protein
MKKKSLLISILLDAISLTLVIAQQQPYPNLRHVETSATIHFDGKEQVHFYAYTVTNSNTNNGNIDELAIDISKSPFSIEIDTIGLRFKNDGFTQGSFWRHFPHVRDRIIPVGFTRSPEKWTASLSNSLTATFFTTRSYAIRPGQSLSGFEMMSKGLPGIRRCIVSPFFDVIALFPDPADTTITYYVPPIDSVRNAVKFYGRTIGPTAPPINFVPTTWCDTLLSYTHQSVELGWLGKQRDDDCDNDERPEDGIIRNIERRLGNARRYLERGDSLKARKELETFVNKLERIWKRSQADKKVGKDEERGRQREAIMTSEAYALLKYNTEYLIDRLPGKKGKE